MGDRMGERRRTWSEKGFPLAGLNLPAFGSFRLDSLVMNSFHRTVRSHNAIPVPGTSIPPLQIMFLADVITVHTQTTPTSSSTRILNYSLHICICICVSDVNKHSPLAVTRASSKSGEYVDGAGFLSV